MGGYVVLSEGYELFSEREPTYDTHGSPYKWASQNDTGNAGIVSVSVVTAVMSQVSTQQPYSVPIISY